MRKKIISVGLAAALMVGTTMTAYAGQWQQDAGGWWYQNDDGSYAKNSWQWIDGNGDGISESYYFDGNGYLVTDTVVDGSTVNGDGAWTVDGTVQTQQSGTQVSGGSQNVVQINTMSFAIPDGYTFDSSVSGWSYYANSGNTAVIGICSEDLGFADQAEMYGAYQETLLDEAMRTATGMNGNKEVKQFASGTWYCYLYPENAVFGIPGSLCAYARINGQYLQMVLFAGQIAGMDTDGIMNSSVK